MLSKRTLLSLSILGLLICTTVQAETPESTRIRPAAPSVNQDKPAKKKSYWQAAAVGAVAVACVATIAAVFAHLYLNKSNSASSGAPQSDPSSTGTSTGDQAAKTKEAAVASELICCQGSKTGSCKGLDATTGKCRHGKHLTPAEHNEQKGKAGFKCSYNAKTGKACVHCGTPAKPGLDGAAARPGATSPGVTLPAAAGRGAAVDQRAAGGGSPAVHASVDGGQAAASSSALPTYDVTADNHFAGIKGLLSAVPAISCDQTTSLHVNLTAHGCNLTTECRKDAQVQAVWHRVGQTNDRSLILGLSFDFRQSEAVNNLKQFIKDNKARAEIFLVHTTNRLGQPWLGDYKLDDRGNLVWFNYANNQWQSF